LPKYQAKRALKPTEARMALPCDRFDRLTDRLRARPSHNLDDFGIALPCAAPTLPTGANCVILAGARQTTSPRAEHTPREHDRMSDEQVIAEFQKYVNDWRATGATPPLAETTVAQLIGVVGSNRPLKDQALGALAQVDWPLAVNFLSALTPKGMVFVPAGPFTMGSDESDEERPPHSVWVDSFYIDKTPVTNKQFGFFWEDATYAEGDEAWAGFEEGRRIVVQVGKRRAPYHWFDDDWNGPDKPVVGLNWYEAMVYARWAGKRLPTEAEWEKTARGLDARRFPWGDAFDPARCNTNIAANAAQATTAAGRFSPGGDSPYGAQDMAGNVREWTASLFKPYPYDAADGRNDINAPGRRVLRGGGFGSQFEDHYRCAYRYPQNPDYIYVGVGMRCASTVPAAPRA